MDTTFDYFVRVINKTSGGDLNHFLELYKRWILDGRLQSGMADPGQPNLRTCQPLK